MYEAGAGLFRNADSTQMAGPMWSAPIHDREFVGKVLEHLETNESLYGTASRMKGMLTVAQEVSLSRVRSLADI